MEPKIGDRVKVVLKRPIQLPNGKIISEDNDFKRETQYNNRSGTVKTTLGSNLCYVDIDGGDGNVLIWNQCLERINKEDNKNMVDYKIKGTLLPRCDGKVSYACTFWGGGFAEEPILNREMVSYGPIEYDGQQCITLERKGYTGQHFFIMKLEDILTIDAKSTLKKSPVIHTGNLVYSDLKVGDYLYEDYGEAQKYISKVTSFERDLARTKYALNITNYKFDSKGTGSVNKSVKHLRYATEEEVHWLEQCVLLNKGITLEEAMLSFTPRTPNNATIVEKVVTGYSIGQIEASINDIPWLEKDDAKELLTEIKQRLGKFKDNNLQDNIASNLEQSVVNDLKLDEFAVTAKKIAESELPF